MIRPLTTIFLCFALLLGLPPVQAAVLCDPCVWVANQRSNSVSVINAAGNTVIANVPAGQTPQVLAVNPSGTRIYVSTHGQGNAGLVTVIDTSNYEIVANVPVGKNPTGLVVNPAGTRLYVLNSGDNTMSVIDTTTNAVIGQPIAVVAGPSDVVISPDGTKLYISASNAGAIQVLATMNNQQIGPLIQIGGAPAGLALNPAGTRLYAGDIIKSSVGVIDTQSATVVATAPAGAGAIAVTSNPAGTRVYAANFGGGQGTTVSVINTSNNTLASTIAVGNSPHGLAMDATGTALYVTNQRSNNVSVVDPASNTVVATIPVDGSPLGVAIVYAGMTNPPPLSVHIASAVNGQPVFDAGSTTTVALNDTIQFTVRVPNIGVGNPAEVRYYLNPNLQYIAASSGSQNLACQKTAFTDPLPNGVQGEATTLKCSLTDGSIPLVVTAKVTGTQAPRDDPYAAVACMPSAFTNCIPVRVAMTYSPPPLATVGSQRTALILLSAPNAPPHPYADKAATANVFYASANPKSARSFFLEASHGLMKITGKDPAADGTAADIYGPYIANSCSDDGIALADPDIDYTQYERVVVSVNDAACGGGGLATGPLTYQTNEGARTFSLLRLYNAALGDATFLGKTGNTALHEYGHTLGLDHAGAWYCGNASVAANGCYGNGYFEPIELVSQAGLYAHPNSVHKERLEWLEGGRVFPVWKSGTYTINAYEDATENVKVLKIPRKLRAPGAPGSPAGGYYYLSYRRPTAPWDDWIANAPGFTNGVAIHMDESGAGFDTALLDATPGSVGGYNDINDGALLLNQTFNDPLSAIDITVTALTAASAQIAVTIQPRATRFAQAAVYPDTGGNVVVANVGSVMGGGTHSIAQSVQLSATAQPGWAFADWLRFAPVQVTQVSLANPYQFTASEDRVLFARFKPAPPPNDNFAAATALASLPSQFSVYTAGATSEPGEPWPSNTCGGIQHGWTIWYTYTPMSNQRVTIDAEGSDNGFSIGVYTGNAINALAPVPGGCSAWTPQQNPHVTFSANAGTTYRIQFDTHGTTNLPTFMEAPANDDFMAATPVSALPAQSVVAMRGASVEASEPVQPPCFPLPLTLSAWYKYTPVASGSLKISGAYGGAQSSWTFPVIAVYTGSALGNLTLVQGACYYQPNSGTPDLTLAVTAGTTYWIQVGGFRIKFLDPIVPTTISFQ